VGLITDDQSHPSHCTGSHYYQMKISISWMEDGWQQTKM
jgi:hypothetical protein